MIKLLVKSAIATTMIPVSIISDVVTLPSTAYNNNNPFGKTKKLISIIKNNAVKAIK